MDKKHKRRLLLAFLITILLLFGGVFVAKNTPLSSEEDPTLRPNPEEMEIFLRNIFCMTTGSDMGATECWMGYYDEVRNIAYFAASYGYGFFNNTVNVEAPYNATCPDLELDYKYYYRDFVFKNEVKTFNLLSLNNSEHFGKIIVYRVHDPQIMSEPWGNLYKDLKGQDGYGYLWVEDRSLSIYWAATERQKKLSLLLITPDMHQDLAYQEFRKKPVEERINNYIERLGIDKSNIVYIDIK